jgi:hypothetical protein
MRPIYEKQSDVENELGVARAISAAWGCDVYKLPVMESADFAIEVSGEYVGLMEVKCRTYSYDQLDKMGGLIISKRKVDAVFNLAKEHDVFVVLAVRLSGVIYVMSRRILSDFEVIKAGRRDRNDPQDIEECYLIPMSCFEVL